MVVRDNDCELNCERIIKPITLETFTRCASFPIFRCLPSSKYFRSIKMLFRQQNGLYFGNNTKQKDHKHALNAVADGTRNSQWHSRIKVPII